MTKFQFLSTFSVISAATFMAISAAPEGMKNCDISQMKEHFSKMENVQTMDDPSGGFALESKMHDVVDLSKSYAQENNCRVFALNGASISQGLLNGMSIGKGEEIPFNTEALKEEGVDKPKVEKILILDAGNAQSRDDLLADYFCKNGKDMARGLKLPIETYAGKSE